MPAMRTLTALALAATLGGCGSLPQMSAPVAAPVPVPAPLPDLALACRMLKASYCAYDVATASYDAASHSARLGRCDTRPEIRTPPALSQVASPPPHAYLTPGGTNAYLLLHTARDEIVLAFRGTIGLGEGLLGYLDWLNNFQASRVSDEWLGNVHFGFHSALFNQATSENLWESLWRVMLRLQQENALAGKKLYLTGHSKGGALAVLAAARMKKELGIAPDAVFTYESPRAGTVDFARRYAALGIPTYRFENRGDIVPHLPPEADETEILAALGLPALTVSWWDPYVAIGRLGFIDWDGVLRFPEDTPEFRAQRSRAFVENVVRGDPRGVRFEELRNRLRLNHRILPGTPSYFDLLCGSPPSAQPAPATR